MTYLLLFLAAGLISSIYLLSFIHIYPCVLPQTVVLATPSITAYILRTICTVNVTPPSAHKRNAHCKELELYISIYIHIYI